LSNGLTVVWGKIFGRRCHINSLLELRPSDCAADDFGRTTTIAAICDRRIRQAHPASEFSIGETFSPGLIAVTDWLGGPDRRY
jgi:hypothetical protein